MTKHYTIPFFISLRGCPHKCIFCDQNRITGKEMILPENVEPQIEKYLKTIPEKESHIEAGFFGGTFTGLPIETQVKFLEPVQRFIKSGQIKGIRLSTRPDFISKSILTFLKKYNVKCIELGVQSMSDKVLSASKRGHTQKDTLRASELITHSGFTLAHQMMVGMPESNFETEYLTAQYAHKLGAKEVRIYPVIVVENTGLAELYKKGKYHTLEEKETIERCAKLILYFESKDIKVIRCGLHPSEGLLNKIDFIAGPFHPAFRQKAESEIFNIMLEYIIEKYKPKEISFNPQDEPYFYGFKKSNRALIDKIPEIKRNNLVRQGNLKAENFVLTRTTLAKKILPEELL